MNKKETVDAIIAANAGWAETDREALMALSDNQLTLVKNALKKSETTAPPAPPKEAAPAQNTKAPETPAVKAPATVDEYISAAPRQVQDVLRNGMAAYNEEKNKLVTVILANKFNSFSKEDLESKPLGELKALARLAGGDTVPAAPRYDGQGISQNAAPTTNEEPVLDVPVMTFTK